MLDTGFFAATARVRVGFRHGACIVVEQGRPLAPYATEGGVWGRLVAFLSHAAVLTGNGYVGIAPEPALATI